MKGASQKESVPKQISGAGGFCCSGAILGKEKNEMPTNGETRPQFAPREITSLWPEITYPSADGLQVRPTLNGKHHSRWYSNSSPPITFKGMISLLTQCLQITMRQNTARQA